MRQWVQERSSIGGGVLSLCAIWSLGCGKTGEADDRPHSTAHYTGRAEPAVRAFCKYRKRCDERGWEVYGGGTLQGCIDYQGCLVDQGVPGSVADFSRSEIDACATAWQEQACHESGEVPLPEACKGPRVGERDAGAAQLGALAGLQSGEALEGEPCLLAQCRADLQCVPLDPLLVVRGLPCGTCTPRIAMGQPCSFQGQCVVDANCIDGTCQQLRSVGEPCTEHGDCESWSCDDGSCGEPWSLERSDYDDLVGRPCDQVSCSGWTSLTCLDGICRVLPDEGEHCTSRCRYGQVCVEGTCVHVGCRIEPGEPCDTYCDGTCDPQAHVCKAPGLEGDACDESAPAFSLPCAAGPCRDGRCVRPASDGETCNYSNDCASQYCAREPECSPAVPAGFRCTIPLSGQGVCSSFPTVEECSGN